MSRTSSDVVVIGAGAIGVAIAWRCAQRGLGVRVVDPQPDRGAWHAAAGMLAPITELHYAESALLRLNLDSLRRYPGFVAEVADVTGLETGYRECGTVSLAWDGADLRALQDLHAFGVTLGLRSQLLSGRELRELEPALAPGVPGGLLAEGDHQVDPRLLRRALAVAAQRAGADFVTGEAALRVDGDRVRGVRVGSDQLTAGTVVLAAGAWSALIDGLPAPFAPPVRPVKGQTVRLRLRGPVRLAHVLRATVKGSPVYVVPREGGEYVVGASTEESGFDLEPRAGAVYELLRDAQTVLPELGEATLDEVSTGLRPGTPDNAPLLGPSGLDGLVLATGHHRNGILLTPATADGIAAHLADGVLPEEFAPFAASRFEVATA
jgi:glycine oxidase